VADLFHVVPLALLALLAVAIWAAGLVRLDVFTPDDVRAWRRLVALRGYATRAGRIERVAAHVPLLRRLQEELDLHRQLAIAGWSETPSGFLLRTFFLSLLSVAVFLTLLAVGLMETGTWPLPPAVSLLVAILVFALQVSWLRSSAGACQEQSERALGDMMMLVAIITDGRGLQVEDAIRILSRCVDHPALEAIVDARGWQRLVRQPHHTTIELYRLIAAEYGIPLFGVVADAAANANVGMSERETYTRVARAVYQNRLADARFRAARAKTLVTIPVAMMLIPLLLLIGAPIFATISGGLGLG
jgi:hypothetical protein